LPGSRVYRRLVSRLHDAQLGLDGHRPKRTFFSHYPLGRIDYVFVSDEVRVLKVEVPRSELIRTASDHLPLLAEIQVG
jgi:endonuclease/exonuclease/phosphatase family metal-dependent hydrolase